jgi:hypothetical protein
MAATWGSLSGRSLAEVVSAWSAQGESGVYAGAHVRAVLAVERMFWFFGLGILVSAQAFINRPRSAPGD